MSVMEHLHSFRVAVACALAGTILGCGGGGGGPGPDSIAVGTDSGTGGVSAAAAFTASTPAPVVGSVVQFDDASTGSPVTWSWDFGDGVVSAQKNTGHAYAASGTYTVSLTITTATTTASTSQRVVVSAPPAGGPKFTLTQTLNDGAQGTTLAFDGLALMTGNLAAQSFFPPGKVADYTGFQYLRDNDPNDMGHNTSFLTRVANNVLLILTDGQIAQLKQLAASQLAEVNEYAYRRFTLMQAFRELADGSAPSANLSLAGVKAASRALYLVDGQISFDRALLYANVYAAMDATQRGYLDSMKGKGWSSWRDVADALVAGKLAGLPRGAATLVMTYASDLFSWYAGTVDADVYFCPERHGTYYGGFYMKDAPAVGHEGYGISEQLTATAGAALIDASQGYATASQAAQLSSLVGIQRSNLYAGAANIVQARTDIVLLLRGLRVTTTDSDTVRAKVLALSGLYGDLDGENNFHYATVFSQVYASMSAAQKVKLAALRGSILTGTYADGTPFDFTTAKIPYVYADPVTDSSVLAPWLGAAAGLF